MQLLANSPKLTSSDLNIILDRVGSDHPIFKRAECLNSAIRDWPLQNLDDTTALVGQLRIEITSSLTKANLKSFLQKRLNEKERIGQNSIWLNLRRLLTSFGSQFSTQSEKNQTGLKSNVDGHVAWEVESVTSLIEFMDHSPNSNTLESALEDFFVEAKSCT